MYVQSKLQVYSVIIFRQVRMAARIVQTKLTEFINVRKRCLLFHLSTASSNHFSPGKKRKKTRQDHGVSFESFLCSCVHNCYAMLCKRKDYFSIHHFVQKVDIAIDVILKVYLTLFSSCQGILVFRFEHVYRPCRRTFL